MQWVFSQASKTLPANINDGAKMKGKKMIQSCTIFSSFGSA
jgi:hypothetical protein